MKSLVTSEHNQDSNEPSFPCPKYLRNMPLLVIESFVKIYKPLKLGVSIHNLWTISKVGVSYRETRRELQIQRKTFSG